METKVKIHLISKNMTHSSRRIRFCGPPPPPAIQWFASAQSDRRFDCPAFCGHLKPDRQSALQWTYAVVALNERS
jgi:hypothetical protein